MAQIISEANNKDARNRLVDIYVTLDEMDDFIQATNTLIERFELFGPMASLMDGIGERVDKMRQAMVVGDKAIYDILEDTKLRDKEVSK